MKKRCIITILLLGSFVSVYSIDINQTQKLTVDTNTAVKQQWGPADIYPSFKGGSKAFSTFLMDNINYPKEAALKHVTGRVYVQFVVETDGSLSDVKAIRDPGNGLGEEAVRVIKTSPKWLPAMYKDKPIRMQYTVPVNFNLAN